MSFVIYEDFCRLFGKMRFMHETEKFSNLFFFLEFYSVTLLLFFIKHFGEIFENLSKFEK